MDNRCGETLCLDGKPEVRKPARATQRREEDSDNGASAARAEGSHFSFGTIRADDGRGEETIQ